MDADLLLLGRWREGDQLAGQELFERHFASVYRFFENKCRGEVDDLAQRTFLQCVRARDRFEGRSTFRTFLFSIARHELHQHLREARRDRAIDFEVSSVADLATTAGTRLARAEEAAQLHAALRSLPVESQLMLEMAYWHELDASELGEVFEMPAATVRTKLFRARKALRARLEKAALDAAGDPLASSVSAVDGEIEPDG